MFESQGYCREQLERHDPCTYEHCRNVAYLMKKFAEWLQFSVALVGEAHTAGFWHDVGKLWIPSGILQKEEPLRLDERQALRQHSYLRYYFLEGQVDLSGIAEYALFHHEWFDGSGYPKGLAGRKIPLLSRMLALCDAFDAMINERPYKFRLEPSMALAEIRKNVGTQFDPELSKEFCALAEERFIPYELNHVAAIAKFRNTCKNEGLHGISDKELQELLQSVSQILMQ
jgi:HD-GYP domain-containing protein (c-di-GMP phosphodiesterase class II)